MSRYEAARYMQQRMAPHIRNISEDRDAQNAMVAVGPTVVGVAVGKAAGPIAGQIAKAATKAAVEKNPGVAVGIAAAVVFAVCPPLAWLVDALNGE